MVKIKSVDRILIKTGCGNREVKGEKYKGYGINKPDPLNNGWVITVINGPHKGQCLPPIFTTKKGCRSMIDSLVKEVGDKPIDADAEKIRKVISESKAYKKLERMYQC
ncbi:hypothetical protein FC831_15715 [Clostridium botulinum]|nr:hypothetical protein ACP50_00765 [Clostridium botulinum]MBY6988464.1 hypothetical protein [Clostridium botulinum]NFH01688.1 hypothetical protein [Clostridium botulinum]NFP41034.1 hypothetical protein [Clostridium botulinum]NFQ58189.1 hypothetical protein [Clostridium botulinum]